MKKLPLSILISLFLVCSLEAQTDTSKQKRDGTEISIGTINGSTTIVGGNQYNYGLDDKDKAKIESIQAQTQKMQLQMNKYMVSLQSDAKYMDSISLLNVQMTTLIKQLQYYKHLSDSLGNRQNIFKPKYVPKRLCDSLDLGDIKIVNNRNNNIVIDMHLESEEYSRFHPLGNIGRIAVDASDTTLNPGLHVGFYDYTIYEERPRVNMAGQIDGTSNEFLKTGRIQITKCGKAILTIK